MSGEIRAAMSLSATKGALKFNFPSTNLTIDMAGTRWSAGVQDIGTTVEQITLGADVASAGWAVFTNTDSTNYVEIGASNGTPYLLRLNALESCLVRLTTTTLYAKANTAAVKLQFMILEA